MMKPITMYQVDAFTEGNYKGNPAAVCMLVEWLDDEVMQALATKINLSETAFMVSVPNGYEIRWFTPGVEVDLCGHATLASAFVLFDVFGFQADTIPFHSRHSGPLNVFKQQGRLYLDFPTDHIEQVDPIDLIQEGIQSQPVELWKGKSDYIAVLESEDSVRHVNPNFEAIAKLDARGLIITAQGKEVDFVSRFFGPQSGVDEDPVTGSAHTSLTPLWSQKLNKKELTAIQLSERGGKLYCEDHGDRCHIGGYARLDSRGMVSL